MAFSPGLSPIAALLSALPPWTRRQHPELGGAGRGCGPQHWNTIIHAQRGHTDRGRLDAHLLQACARDPQSCEAIPRGSAGGALVVVSAVPTLALARLERRLLGGEWQNPAAPINGGA